MAVDPAELETCKRRGHKAPNLSTRLWSRCEWCGMWLREVVKIEEREDDPPADEQDPMIRLKKRYGPESE